MRNLVLVSMLTLLASMPAAAKRLILDFDDLAARAEEEVEITLDASMLRMAAGFLSGEDRDERAVRDMIAGLSGIYVRSYQFSKSGQYDPRIFEEVKSQLGPTWKPFVNVRSKTKENVTIMADMRGDEIHGLVIIAAEPLEFTVVSIEGSIDIDRLGDLEGQFGIPQISAEEIDRD
jgi:hypothetical protein